MSLAAVLDMGRSGLPGRKISEATGVPQTTVKRWLRQHGIKRPTRVGQIRKDVRELHAKGWTDSMIAERILISRSGITWHRRRLGLSSNGQGAFARQRIAAAVRHAATRRGIKGFEVYRDLKWREQAREAGWPAAVNGKALGPANLRILDALWDSPKTLKQLRLAQGSPIMRRLLKAGLVVCLGRLGEGGVAGYKVNLYAVAIDVERNQKIV